MTVSEVQEHLELRAAARSVHEETCDDRLESATGIEFKVVDQRGSVTRHGHVYECPINESATPARPSVDGHTFACNTLYINRLTNILASTH